MVKRKKIIFFPVFFAIIMLAACGTAPNEAQKGTDSDPGLKPSSVTTKFDKGAFGAMASYMSAGRAIGDESGLFCFEFDSEYRPVLARYTLAEGVLSQFTVLAESCVPEYLAECEGRLYYLNSGAVESIGSDGADRRVLLPGVYSSLQVYEGSLYCRGDDSVLYRAGLDGTGISPVLDSCCYPYVFEGYIIYQSEKDGDSLHLCRLDGSEDRKLTGLPSYAPVIYGDTVYYSQRGKAGMALCSVALNGGAVAVYDAPPFSGTAEFYLNEGELTARLMTASGQYIAAEPFSQGSTMPDYRYLRLDYSGEEGRVDALYEAGARIIRFVYTQPGGELGYIAGRIV